MIIMNAFSAQLLATILANLTMFSAGMIMYWSSSALPKLLASDSDLPLTSDQSSWVVSMNNFGAIFGPLLVVLLADRIGRKWTIYLTVLPMLASWVMIGLAKNYQLLYVARFVGGLGVGSVFAVMPMYLGEIADDKIRGGLGTVLVMMAYSGAVAISSVGPWVSRQMLAFVSALPIIIFLITFFWMPESPYYYLMKGKRDAAYTSLAWLRRRSQLEEELTTIENDVRLQQQNKISIFKLVTNLGNRRAFFITLGLNTLQQFSGIYAIASYSTLIFEETGSSISSDVSTIIMNIVALVSGICVGFTTDIAGRRPILIVTTIGLFISLLAIGVFYHLQDLGLDVSGINWLPLVGIILFYVMYTGGAGSQTYVISSEIFPTDVKALANTAISTYSSACGMLVSKLYLVVADAFGTYVSFYIFAGCSAIGIAFVYVFVPETKGRSLQDIQSKLNERTNSTDDILKHSNVG